ncbi:MAG: amidohydrolase family protein [Parvularculaceae bacterium]
MRVPKGACDAHSHVFGPFDAFPPKAPSVYALPDTPLETHTAYRNTIGVDYGVLTQPAPYADDPSAMLDALRRSGGSLRGTAVAKAGIAPAALEAWRDAGVRALRFIEMRTPSGGRYPGSAGLTDLLALEPILQELGMHAQLWINAHDIAANASQLDRIEIPLVFDHMGQPDANAGPDHVDFLALLRLLKDGGRWVKLSTCRVTRNASEDAVHKLHDAFIETRPDALVWGTDWPFVRMDTPPDAGALMDQFLNWTADESLIRQILVDNPKTLYDF